MTWARKQKSLGTTKFQAHPNSMAGVIGRKPSGSTMTFSQLELFGASARCSHLYLINPAIVSPKSQMIAKLIEPHVDDINNDFAVLASTDFLKDFVKSYFVGTVAAGLAYLAMTDNGYVWSDHFERVRSQQTRIKRPDFVFSGATTGVALMEAKGSRSGSAGAFNTTVSDGYTDQGTPSRQLHSRRHRNPWLLYRGVAPVDQIWPSSSSIIPMSLR